LRGTYRKHVDFIVLQTNKNWLEEINDGNIPTILWRNISTMADSGHGYIRPTKKRNRPSRRHMMSFPMVFPVAQFRFCCQVGNSPTCWTCQPTIIAQQYKGVVSRIGGSASVIVELAMFGYDPFSNTPKYHCNLLDFCQIIISPLHPHYLLAM
jgi:hypothetical protein